VDTHDDMEVEAAETTDDPIIPPSGMDTLANDASPPPGLQALSASSVSASPSPDSLQKPDDRRTTGWIAESWSPEAWDAWNARQQTERDYESHEASAYEDEGWVIGERPNRSYPQQYREHLMRRTIRRLTPQIMPLTSICFGSRMSCRTIGRLREAIPPPTFRRVFREFKNHAELADSICTVREDQRRIPNRWQNHLPRLQRVRQLITEYIDHAEELVKCHGHLDGLKEYAVTNRIEFWNADKQGNGLLYTHEYEYLYALHRFRINES